MGTHFFLIMTNGIKYSLQLLMPEWKEKRLVIIKRDSKQCTKCGTTKYLQVHHKKYIENKMAWEVPDDYLITLCRDCHKKAHGISNKPSLKIKPKVKKVSKKQIKGKNTYLSKELKKLSKRDKAIQKRYNSREAG